MDKDVIVIESSDDEDAPPRKLPKTGASSSPATSQIKGTTITRVKGAIKKTVPMFKLGYDLTNKKKDHVPAKSAINNTTVDLTLAIEHTNNKTTVESAPKQQIKTSAAIETTKSDAAIKRPLFVLKSNASPSTSSTSLPTKKATPNVSSNKPSTINEKSPIAIQKTMTKPSKRITPRKLSSSVSMRAHSLEKSSDSDGGSHEMLSTLANGGTGNASAIESNETPEQGTVHRKVDVTPKTPLNDEYKLLIETCKNADKSDDMQHLIEHKLIKYYQSVHRNFVNSKSFLRTVSETTRSIQAKPNLVFVAIRGLLEELKTRRDSSKIMVIDDQDPHPNDSITGDKIKDLKIRKLSAALSKLNRKIAMLEEEEVDFDDEINSKYMISERCKKRAWTIYEKICDLTGESKDAQRLVKKPIRFHDSPFPEFNRTLEKFVNKTNSFPDMFDVLRCMQHCNKEYGYRLTTEECTHHAKNAFIQVGRKLQKRRKSDLYEMVSYYTRDFKDPALEDKMLKVKLEENQKFNNRQMKAVIDKFADHQDHRTDGDDSVTAQPEPGANQANTLVTTPVKNESIDIGGPSTSNNLNSSTITLSSGGKTPPRTPNLFDDNDLIMSGDNQIDLLDVAKFETPINLDDDDMDFPMEISNVMSIDDFNFGA